MIKITNESFLETLVLHLAFDLLSSSIVLGVLKWISYSVLAAQKEIKVRQGYNARKLLLQGHRLLEAVSS